MRTNQFFYIFSFLILLLSACNIGKKLPKGTYLYKGAIYAIQKDSGNSTNTRSVRKLIKRNTAPIANKTVLGFPYKVWVWYAVGEPKKQKGFKYWLRNKFGEAPVLSTQLNLKVNVENFENTLANKGYFKSVVKADTTIKGARVTAHYKIKLGFPYTIDTVKWILDSASDIGKVVYQMDAKESYVKTKQQFNLNDIKAERTRTDIFLKTKGYYYFNPDFILAQVDSSLGNHHANIFFRLKSTIPVAAVVPQQVQKITIFPNYTLLYPPPDTSKNGLIVYDGIYIRDTIHAIKPAALTRAITYRNGDLYNITEHNKSLNRYINMGLYKFVKSRYIGDTDTLIPRRISVLYYLTPMPKKSVQAEIGSFSKTNSFNGVQTNISFKNRNAFKGAEQFFIKLYGAFEGSNNDSLKANNNFRLGSEASLSFPRFLAPFKIKESNYFPPRTKFTIGYEWLRRQALYTKNYFRFQYDFTWKETVNREHTLAPISITYNTTSDFSSTYLALVNQYPALQISNVPELILGSNYNFTYRGVNPNSADIFFINTNVDLAGNITGLINGKATPYSKTILGAYYAQFARADMDFRYSRKLGTDFYLVNRLFLGVGLPYGNSSFLPFSRQFIIGGSGSLRGFLPRQLGPGRMRSTAIQQLYYPQVGGDYKLEMNSELRFPILSKIKGAVFVDAGNIWSKDSILYGKEAQFTKQFMKDIALDAGIGFRFDISILIIRLDIATPLRKPYLERGKEWVIREIQPFNNLWRRENLILNIAIGYPF
ncbi:MAG: BamA/TamA family outer membrane protein [Sediminibacterium sp.]|nr:BamA/TamA family outer membrane protein [Sediminibacterium sp.]